MTKFGLVNRASVALSTLSLTLFSNMAAHATGSTGSADAAIEGVESIAGTILGFLTG